MVSPAFGGTAPTRRTVPLKAGALCPLGLVDAAFTHRKTDYFLTNKQTLERRQKDKRQDADNVCEMNVYATVETVMWRNVRGQSVQRVHSLHRNYRGGGGGGMEYMRVCVCVCVSVCKCVFRPVPLPQQRQTGALSHYLLPLQADYWPETSTGNRQLHSAFQVCTGP